MSAQSVPYGSPLGSYAFLFQQFSPSNGVASLPVPSTQSALACLTAKRYAVPLPLASECWAAEKLTEVMVAYSPARADRSNRCRLRTGFNLYADRWLPTVWYTWAPLFFHSGLYGGLCHESHASSEPTYPSTPSWNVATSAGAAAATRPTTANPTIAIHCPVFILHLCFPGKCPRYRPVLGRHCLNSWHSCSIRSRAYLRPTRTAAVPP